MSVARNLADIIGGGSTVVSSGLPTGTVLQVKTATKTDTQSTTSGTFTDITGLSVSITPSSTSNKIMVLCSVFMSTSFYWTPLRILRDSTQINAPDAAGSNRYLVNACGSTQTLGTYMPQSINVSALDSPSSTSAITYKAQFCVLISDASYTSYINTTERDSDNSNGYDVRGSSSITVMEIAG